jgi:hypothetical protein
VSGGDHCWFKRSNGEEKPVTGDDDDDDDDDDDMYPSQYHNFLK